jgi:hypothetical protein
MKKNLQKVFQVSLKFLFFTSQKIIKHHGKKFTKSSPGEFRPKFQFLCIKIKKRLFNIQILNYFWLVFSKFYFAKPKTFDFI